jgi:HEAT repeat protein
MSGDRNADREIELLVGATNDVSPQVQAAAISSLGQIGKRATKALPPLLALMKREKDPQIYMKSCRALAKIAPEKLEVLSALKEALKHANTEVRISAVQSLGEVGSSAKPVTRELLETLQIKDVTDEQLADALRSAVLRALGQIGPDPDQVIPSLVSLVENKTLSSDIRRRAVILIGKMGPKAKDAIPVIIDILKKESFGFLEEGTQTLCNIGPAAMPKLIEAIDDSAGTKACQSLVHALGRMRPVSEEMIVSLTKVVQHLGGIARDDASQALAGIGPGAVPHLIRLLDAKSPQIRITAIRTLEQIGPDAKAAIPILADIAKRKVALTGPEGIEEERVRKASGEALKRIDMGRERPNPK